MHNSSVSDWIWLDVFFVWVSIVSSYVPGDKEISIVPGFVPSGKFDVYIYYCML